MMKIKPMVIPYVQPARTKFGLAVANHLSRAISDLYADYIRAFDSMDSAAMNRAYDALLRAEVAYNRAIKDADEEEDARKGKEIGPCHHGCHECEGVCESADMVFCACLIDCRVGAICLGCIEVHITKSRSIGSHVFTPHNSFWCQASALAERIIGRG